jgi:hypothetical protein
MSVKSDRGPYDGEPFYCEACGLGLGEFMACEEAGCQLESKEKAMQRKQLREARAH